MITGYPGPSEVGTGVTLSCDHSGANPTEVTYQWFKGTDPNPVGTAETLALTGTTGESGDYKCTVENQVATSPVESTSLTVFFAGELYLDIICEVLFFSSVP